MGRLQLTSDTCSLTGDCDRRLIYFNSKAHDLFLDGLLHRRAAGRLVIKEVLTYGRLHENLGMACLPYLDGEAHDLLLDGLLRRRRAAGRPIGLQVQRRAAVQHCAHRAASKA